MRNPLVAITACVVFVAGCNDANTAMPQSFENRPIYHRDSGASLQSSLVRYVVLYSFVDNQNGRSPSGQLVRDAAGSLYGTTQFGGTFSSGTVYKLDSHGIETVLHSFNLEDGSWPMAGLVGDAAGNLYGTTYDGGSNAYGNVFKVDSSGNETSLHSFSLTDGAWPFADLVVDAAGNLYGTTDGGGDMSCSGTGCGVVFKLDPSGNETVLHSFSGPEGSYPLAGLIRDTAGNLYGTTSKGGPRGCLFSCGVVFKINSSGHETVLHYFNGTDGANPQADLIRDGAGNLYGTTTQGGSMNCNLGCGVVFKINRHRLETVLHSFSSGQDGIQPQAGLVRDAAGNLYGSTAYGGVSNSGVVFKLEPNGKESILHSFTMLDGRPEAALIRDSAGNLYGSTYLGGIVFELVHARSTTLP